MTRISRSAPKTVAARKSKTHAKAAPAKKPKTAKADALVAPAKRAAAPSVKLLVSTTENMMRTETDDALKKLVTDLGGKVLSDNTIFATTAVIDVPAAKVGAATAGIAKLHGLSAFSIDSLAASGTGKGAASGGEIVTHLSTGPLPQRTEAARALVERLRADGPGAFRTAQRDEIAGALYELASPLVAAFNTVWQNQYSEIATGMQHSLESAGKKVDWGQVRGDATRAQELPQNAQATAGLRTQISRVSEGLALLDSPRSLGLLEQLMPHARNAGTNFVLQHPDVEQRVFDNWLGVAQTRIDQSDFSTPTPEKGWQQPMSSGGYENLSGRRNAWTKYEWTMDYPFERTGSAPDLLLTGPRGPQLATQLVDFVVANEGKVITQAAQKEAAQVKIEQGRLERMSSPEFRAQAGAEQMKGLLDEAMEQWRENSAMNANTALDAIISSLRNGAWGTNGAADVQTYVEATLPVYGQLLERAKTPGVLTLVADEALTMIETAKVNRSTFAEPAKADAAAAKLSAQLGPLVKLAEMKLANRNDDETGLTDAQKHARTAANATAVMDLLEGEMKKPTVPALASVVKAEAHEQADWFNGIAQYGHLAGHDDVIARARALRDATAQV